MGKNQANTKKSIALADVGSQRKNQANTKKSIAPAGVANQYSRTMNTSMNQRDLADSDADTDAVSGPSFWGAAWGSSV
jgi:hypothetical protein